MKIDMKVGSFIGLKHKLLLLRGHAIQEVANLFLSMVHG